MREIVNFGISKWTMINLDVLQRPMCSTESDDYQRFRAWDFMGSSQNEPLLMVN